MKPKSNRNHSTSDPTTAIVDDNTSQGDGVAVNDEEAVQ